MFSVDNHSSFLKSFYLVVLDRFLLLIANKSIVTEHDNRPNNPPPTAIRSSWFSFSEKIQIHMYWSKYKSYQKTFIYLKKKWKRLFVDRWVFSDVYKSYHWSKVSVFQLKKIKPDFIENET